VARDFCFGSYMSHCLAPAIELLNRKGEYRDQLFAQTAFVEACWWLNLTIACEYVDEGYASELFKKQQVLFSIPTVKALLNESQYLASDDLLVFLRHTEPARAFEEMIFRVKPDFKSPVSERSHLQTALILNGEFERKPAARTLLSHILFVNDGEWEGILNYVHDHHEETRHELVDTTYMPDDSKQPNNSLIVGFVQVVSHMATINELFEGLRHEDQNNDHKELENRIKGIMSGRINISSERFRDRFLSLGNLAYESMAELAKSSKDIVPALMASPDDFQQRLRALMAQWQPEPVLGRVLVES
jgi:hypothetical protein